jgi:hypothetical protein
VAGSKLEPSGEGVGTDDSGDHESVHPASTESTCPVM